MRLAISQHQTISNKRYKIGEKLYACVVSAEPIYDQDGSEVPWRINWEAGKFVLSPDCSGRHATAAITAMCIMASKRENGDAVNIPAVVERMLYDRGLEDERKSRFSLPPKTRLYVGCAALAVLTSAAIWVQASFWESHPGSTVEQQVEVEPILSFPELLPNTPMLSVDFEDIVVAKSHPATSGFIGVSKLNHVLLIRGESLYTRIMQPDEGKHVRSVNPSADDRHLVVTDWAGTLYFSGIDGVGEPIRVPTGEDVVEAFHSGKHEVTWHTSFNETFVTDLKTMETQEVVDTEYAIPTTSVFGVSASVGLNAHGERAALIKVDPGLPPLSAKLGVDEELVAADVSDDRCTAVLVFSSNRLVIWRKGPEPWHSYEGVGHRFLMMSTPRKMILSRSGDRIFLFANMVYELDASDLHTGFLPLRMSFMRDKWMDVGMNHESGHLVSASPEKGVIWKIAR